MAAAELFFFFKVKQFALQKKSLTVDFCVFLTCN